MIRADPMMESVPPTLMRTPKAIRPAAEKSDMVVPFYDGKWMMLYRKLLTNGKL
jgi:hypothetical protein